MRAFLAITLVFTVSQAWAQGPDTMKTDAIYNAGGSRGRERLSHAAVSENSGAAGTPVPSEESELKGTLNSDSLHPILGATPGMAAPIPADGMGSEAEHTGRNDYINPGEDSPNFPIGAPGPQSEQGYTRFIPQETLINPAGGRRIAASGVPARNPDVAEEDMPESVSEMVNENREPENARRYNPLVGEGTPLGLASDTAGSPDTLGSVTPLSNRKFESSDGSGNIEVGDNPGRRPEMGEVDGLQFLPAGSPSEEAGSADDYGSSISRVQPIQRRVVIVVPPGVHLEGARSDYTPDLSFSSEPQTEDSPASSSTYAQNRFGDSEDPYSLEESYDDHISRNFRASGRHHDVFGGRENAPRDSRHSDELGQHKYAILLISPRGGGSDLLNSLEEPEQRETVLAL